jgi:hypothetical protein
LADAVLLVLALRARSVRPAGDRLGRRFAAGVGCWLVGDFGPCWSPSRLLRDPSPNPDPIPLPPIHIGEIRLGDPCSVACDSVDALRRPAPAFVGCDNNLPDSGRNPNLPDASEFILVDDPALTR